ncbi:hypothetical protein NEHOM01_0868 [Nematocida homosporus]|uniref:uncharacterized protein n=1 Tax=Nematocida homosporus TaxID=1912981 RepID=UPI00221FF8E5|nr:uncharacterized protein NEHOM01_0868 [Nematocida homosporus]KAI5185509.1 hypothetical protein NEHOM01_0868 [Nematocida homosporus]
MNKSTSKTSNTTKSTEQTDHSHLPNPFNAPNTTSTTPSKKPREKPFTAKDFIQSKFGLSLLNQATPIYHRRLAQIQAQSDTTPSTQHYQHLRLLCKLYTSWIQASALCGNKRTRAYHHLKAVQIAVKTTKVPTTTDTNPTSDITTKSKTSVAKSTPKTYKSTPAKSHTFIEDSSPSMSMSLPSGIFSSTQEDQSTLEQTLADLFDSD